MGKTRNMCKLEGKCAMILLSLSAIALIVGLVMVVVGPGVNSGNSGEIVLFVGAGLLIANIASWVGFTIYLLVNTCIQKRALQLVG